MAELTGVEARSRSCCTPKRKASCCEPRAKAECCGADGGGCDCESGGPTDSAEAEAGGALDGASG